MLPRGARSSPPAERWLMLARRVTAMCRSLRWAERPPPTVVFRDRSGARLDAPSALLAVWIRRGAGAEVSECRLRKTAFGAPFEGLLCGYALPGNPGRRGRLWAGVVELVDTLDLGSSALCVGVRVPPPAESQQKARFF